MRYSVVAAALALAVAAPAHAIPPEAQQALMGWSAFKVLGRDRNVYQVYVSATISDGHAVGPRWSGVGIRIGKCGSNGFCDPAVEKRYWAPLQASQYDISDEKKWSVRLSAFGKPFTMTFTGPGREGTTTTMAYPSGPTDVTLYEMWPVTARVTVLGVTCTTTLGGAGRTTTVHLTGRPEPPFGRIPATAPAGVPSPARACRPM